MVLKLHTVMPKMLQKTKQLPPFVAYDYKLDVNKRVLRVLEDWKEEKLAEWSEDSEDDKAIDAASKALLNDRLS